MGIETLLLGGLAAASVASTLFAPQPTAPQVQQPAGAADAARASGATVRVGVRDETEESDTPQVTTPFTEQRKRAQTINGLGRGGLAI
ncbi:hypothetical protein CPT_Paso_036 [Rhizobium phage Paso]|uniref:Uncharacterized protein n=1 Tax=Rhizobium phage Paso TaxID=2767574 RepID=A0A7L8G4Q8_9CAUD|nr:hypothetical protein CPT_Paso_036 [Rhizobium phage Paso]